jgi:hypothetical protein
MEIIPQEEVPLGFRYPSSYLRLIEMGLVRFEPWYFLNREIGRLRFESLTRSHSSNRFLPFAARQDSDVLACWDLSSTCRIVVFDSQDETGDRPRLEFKSFWEWFRHAIEDLIAFEPQGMDD